MLPTVREGAMGSLSLREQTPSRQIFQNAGEDGSVVVGKILENSAYAFGYNAQSGTYGDLVAQGVIDPAKDHSRKEGFS